MADKSEKSPVKIDVGLGAKAEAKLNVKTEIPSSSMGRLVDAVTDMFRPFSERRGLKADQIRLQREEVAIDIATLARKRLEIEKAETLPVPNKILIPLIEKSSQEDIDDHVMKSKWAELLASASMDKGVHPRMVQIMSEITYKEASLLELIALNEFEQVELPYRTYADSNVDTSIGSGTHNNIHECLEHIEYASEQDAMNLIQDVYNRPGCILYVAVMPLLSGGALDGGVKYDKDHRLAYELCESLGLLRRVDLSFSAKVKSHHLPIDITYYHLSAIGEELITLSSPDLIAKLEKAQKENCDAHRERDGTYSSNRRSISRSVLSNRVIEGENWDEYDAEEHI